MRYPATSNPIAVFVALATSLTAGLAHVQPATFQQRLSALRQQNAYQQQQMAVQLAVQQTNVLVQQALRHGEVPQPSGFYRPLNFQQQASALQMALQQTMALQQATLQSNSRPTQGALLQINAVQTSLQLTSTLQTAAQIQNGQLTPAQVQTLFREQTSLMGLLVSPPPQIPRTAQGR